MRADRSRVDIAIYQRGEIAANPRLISSFAIVNTAGFASSPRATTVVVGPTCTFALLSFLEHRRLCGTYEYVAWFFFCATLLVLKTVIFVAPFASFRM